MGKRPPKRMSALEMVTQQRLTQQRLTQLENDLEELAAVVMHLRNQLAEGVTLSLKVEGRPLPIKSNVLSGQPC